MNPESRDQKTERFLNNLQKAIELPINEPGRLKCMHDAWNDYFDLTTDSRKIGSDHFMRIVQDKRLEIERLSGAKISSTFDVKEFARGMFHV
jgi:hypothetical protein